MTLVVHLRSSSCRGRLKAGPLLLRTQGLSVTCTTQSTCSVSCQQQSSEYGSSHDYAVPCTSGHASQERLPHWHTGVLPVTGAKNFGCQESWYACLVVDHAEVLVGVGLACFASPMGQATQLCSGHCRVSRVQVPGCRVEQEPSAAQGSCRVACKQQPLSMGSGFRRAAQPVPCRCNQKLGAVLGIWKGGSLVLLQVRGLTGPA